MNSVEPDRIVYVSPPGRPYDAVPEQPQVSRILFDLGYRNSDSLFHDRLVLVEGKSDAEILPILLLADGEFAKDELDRTGFPVLEGAGRGARGVQTSIMRYEQLLSAVGRASLPRIYLLDGDRKTDEKALLEGTKSPVTGESIVARFLLRSEIENYLLVSEALSAAISEELILKTSGGNATPEEITAAIETLLQDETLYPQGKLLNRDALQQVKGSLLLERLYERYRLSYHKERSGTLIAKHISARNQPGLPEIVSLVKPVFLRSPKRG
jgi:predicted ATP-dependent endonuclease of OLD family